MGFGETIITLAQRGIVAVGVVLSANTSVTLFGQMVPLDTPGQIVAWLVSSGVLYQFVREVLNLLDGKKSTQAGTALGDKMMPI